MASGSGMRPLNLHISALSNNEYELYTQTLEEIALLDGTQTQQGDESDSRWEQTSVGVRNVRAWIRGRYPCITIVDLDSVRLYVPSVIIILTQLSTDSKILPS